MCPHEACEFAEPIGAVHDRMTLSLCISQHEVTICNDKTETKYLMTDHLYKYIVVYL